MPSATAWRGALAGARVTPDILHVKSKKLEAARSSTVVATADDEQPAPIGGMRVGKGPVYETRCPARPRPCGGGAHHHRPQPWMSSAIEVIPRLIADSLKFPNPKTSWGGPGVRSKRYSDIG